MHAEQVLEDDIGTCRNSISITSVKKMTSTVGTSIPTGKNSDMSVRAINKGSGFIALMLISNMRWSWLWLTPHKERAPEGRRPAPVRARMNR